VRGGRRAWRGIGAALAVLLLAGCATPASSPPAAAPASAATTPAPDLPESARLVFEVFDALDRDYVTAPDFARLRLSAVRALAVDLPAERYTVTETPAGVRVDYGPAGVAREALTLGGAPTAREAARDVGRAVDAAAVVAPGVDPVARSYAMLGRVLRELDAQSALIEPRERRESPDGETGIVLGRRGGTLMVVDIVEGSPAARAGVRPGEHLVSVNGAELRERKASEVSARLRGSIGSRVMVGLQGPGALAPRQLELTRAAVVMPILVHEDLGGGIVRFALRRFSDRAPRVLAAALDERARHGLRAIVLDLRDDPGGLLTVAVEVAELFLQPGRLVSYTEGRVRTANLRFTSRARAEGRPGYATEPLVVLVNEESAGASEIVAGALQDWARGPVVGTTTTGHGSIQKVIELSSGAAVRLTNAFLFTPKGRLIQERGIVPDEAVPSGRGLTPDPPLRRAIDLLSTRLPNA
jgi:carboxyl-terminal processing protease